MTRLDIEQEKPDVPGDLEELAAKLLQSALKLPHGPERQKILEQISGFRVRIDVLTAKMNTTAAEKGDKQLKAMASSGPRD